jgi:hypothetical protein
VAPWLCGQLKSKKRNPIQKFHFRPNSPSKLSNSPYFQHFSTSISSVPLKKLIFYIVHSKYVTKTQKYVKIVGREPSFFHHQHPTGVLALWPPDLLQPTTNRNRLILTRET